MQKIKKAVYQNNKRLTYDFLNNISGNIISVDKLSDEYHSVVDKVFAGDKMYLNPILNSGTVVIQQTEDAPVAMLNNKNFYTLFIICNFQCEEDPWDRLVWTLEYGYYNYTSFEKESFMAAKDHIDKTIKSGAFNVPAEHATEYLAKVVLQTEKTFPIDENGNLLMEDSLLCLSFENSTTDVLKSRGYTEEFISRYLRENTDIDSTRSDLDEIILNFMTVFGAVNYLLQHPEEKDIKRRQKSSKSSKEFSPGVKTPAAVSNSEPKIVNLNGLSIRVSTNKVVNALRSKKIVRSADCWSVRGHYRHYKNGKTVFIKSYEKGKNRNSGAHTRNTYYKI